MERHLNLIKTGASKTEKRVFPRFPFSYLTFKGPGNGDAKVFEVKDISFTGMQLSLKDGGHNYASGNDVEGSLHWRGLSLDIIGKVKWVQGRRLGVAFSLSSEFDQRIKNFLSIDNIVSSMRPVHKAGLDMELPSNLKYWLRSDGPVEIFIWQHNDGEHSRFQMIMMDNFLEWEDGVGIRTGKVIQKDDLETPLTSEDEFTFELDDGVDEKKVRFAKDVVDKLPDNYISTESAKFLQLKLTF